MTKVSLYTHLPSAAKLIFELDGDKVSMKPIGGAEGVPPGMMLMEGEQVVCWIGAQDYGIAVVEDERLIKVEINALSS